MSNLETDLPGGFILYPVETSLAEVKASDLIAEATEAGKQASSSCRIGKV